MKCLGAIEHSSKASPSVAIFRVLERPQSREIEPTPSEQGAFRRQTFQLDCGVAKR